MKKVRLIFQSWVRRLEGPGSRTWTQQRVRMFHVNHRWGSWGPTAQSWIWKWWNIFSGSILYLKLLIWSIFAVNKGQPPGSLLSKHVQKNAISPDRGIGWHRGSCLGAQIIDLFQVHECQNRDNTTLPRRWLTWNRRTRCWGNEK